MKEACQQICAFCEYLWAVRTEIRLPPIFGPNKNKNTPEPKKRLYVLSKMSHVAREKAKLVIADQSMKCIKVVREWGRVEDSAVGQ